MQLTPEQIQGILELVPRAQADRLKGNSPYIRIGYWNRIQDLDTLQAGLAKLGLTVSEDQYDDEDTGRGYSYPLSQIQNKDMINESKEEVEYLMDKFYEYRILAAEAGTNGADQEYEDFSKQAMEYYERAIAEMDKDAADMTDHLSDEDKALPNKPMNERFEKLAGINESNLSLIQANLSRTLELIQMYIDNVSDGGMSAEAAVEKIDDILSGSEEMDGYDIAFLKGEEDQY